MTFLKGDIIRYEGGAVRTWGITIGYLYVVADWFDEPYVYITDDVGVRRYCVARHFKLIIESKNHYAV